jgi:hypothetical protein
MRKRSQFLSSLSTINMTEFLCKACKQVFTSKYNFSRHLNSRKHKSAGKLRCSKCKAMFFRKDNLYRHEQTAHLEVEEVLSFRCGICQLCFKNKQMLLDHRQSEHVVHSDFRIVESAHNKQCQLLRAFFPETIQSLDEGLFYAYDHMCRLTEALSVDINYYKINFTVHIEMYRLDEEGQVTQEEVFPFRGFGAVIGVETDRIPELRRVVGDIERAADEFISQGSGWIIHRPMFLDAEVVQCLPMQGGSCGVHIAGYLRGKGVMPVVINKADDGMCFYYAVASHFERSGDEKKLQKFIREQVNIKEEFESHVKLDDITAFEENNSRLNLAINVVYKDENDDLVPVRASKNKSTTANIIVMLLFHTSVQKNGKQEDVMHYAYVADPARMFAKRTQSSTGKIRTDNVFICWNCCNVLRSRGAYDSHISFCHTTKCQNVTLPAEGETISFDTQSKMQAKHFRSAFLLLYDLEALQIDPEKPCTCSPQVLEDTKKWKNMTNDEKADVIMEQTMLEGEKTVQWEGSQFEAMLEGRKLPKKPHPVPLKQRLPKLCHHRTQVLKEQPPFCYTALLVDRENVVREEKTYVGADAADNLICTVLNFASKYLPELTPGVPMDQMTVSEKKQAQNKSICYLCDEIMDYAEKVLDHDHLTGKFLGVAHNICNLKRREQCVLTCFAHNFSGYDSHFLVRSMNKFPNRIHRINAIPLNTQKFKCIILNDRIRFLDSYAFLMGSLANLVDTLTKTNCPFNILEHLVPEKEKRKLLLRKGVYPYSYATSEDVLRTTTSLPDRQCFDNDLTGEKCSEEDYAHAQNVWNAFGCTSMLDYTVLYVKSDVYLLAEVVMDFRNTIFDCFELDMCQYLSLPHLAKDILLKETGAEIELIHNEELNDLLQRNIRGGLSFVNVRHAKRIVMSYNEEKGWRCIIYFDANNLYGNSMSFPLPLRGHRFMTEKELADFDPIRDISMEDGPGYILEVDLDYPEELHLKHNSFPLAPESMEIVWNDLSPYSRRCLEVLQKPTRSYKSRKLTSTFKPR